jgi:putative transposase
MFWPKQGSQLLWRLTVRERPAKSCFRFWQEGPGFDRNLFCAEAILSSLEYIHHNPVKRGLCRRAVDWKWSSARYYLTVPARQYPNLPMIHGLPEAWLS